jgi:hypothetical protein
MKKRKYNRFTEKQGEENETHERLKKNCTKPISQGPPSEKWTALIKRKSSKSRPYCTRLFLHFLRNRSQNAPNQHSCPRSCPHSCPHSCLRCHSKARNSNFEQAKFQMSEIGFQNSNLQMSRFMRYYSQIFKFPLQNVPIYCRKAARGSERYRQNVIKLKRRIPIFDLFLEKPRKKLFFLSNKNG